MREELDMLRTHKADRVDLKRLEHRLSSQINETAISAGAGASQRPILTNEGESEERFAGKAWLKCFGCTRPSGKQGIHEAIV